MSSIIVTTNEIAIKTRLPEHSYYGDVYKYENEKGVFVKQDIRTLARNAVVKLEKGIETFGLTIGVIDVLESFTDKEEEDFIECVKSSMYELLTTSAYVYVGKHVYYLKNNIGAIQVTKRYKPVVIYDQCSSIVDSSIFSPNHTFVSVGEFDDFYKSHPDISRVSGIILFYLDSKLIRVLSRYKDLFTNPITVFSERKLSGDDKYVLDDNEYMLLYFYREFGNFIASAKRLCNWFEIYKYSASQEAKSGSVTNIDMKYVENRYKEESGKFSIQSNPRERSDYPFPGNLFNNVRDELEIINFKATPHARNIGSEIEELQSRGRIRPTTLPKSKLKRLVNKHDITFFIGDALPSDSVMRSNFKHNTVWIALEVNLVARSISVSILYNDDVDSVGLKGLMFMCSKEAVSLGYESMHTELKDVSLDVFLKKLEENIDLVNVSPESILVDL